MWSGGGKGPVSKTAARPTDNECLSVNRTQLSEDLFCGTQVHNALWQLKYCYVLQVGETCARQMQFVRMSHDMKLSDLTMHSHSLVLHPTIGNSCNLLNSLTNSVYLAILIRFSNILSMLDRNIQHIIGFSLFVYVCTMIDSASVLPCYHKIEQH